MSILDDVRYMFSEAVIEYNASRADEFRPFKPIPAPSQGTRGALIGALNRELGGDMNRKQFLKALTGHSSSKDLLDAEWYALAIVVSFGEMQKWQLSPDGAELARRVLAAHIEETGAGKQINMF